MCFCWVYAFLIPEVLLAPEADKHFQVYVSVTSDDQKAFIESHIKRELRALHDVEIASWDTAEYFLTIVVLEQIYKSGGKTGGISIAYCWYKRNPVPKGFRNLKLPYLTDEGVKSYWESRDKSFSFSAPRLGVMNYYTKNLDTACKSIVADFDQALLEKRREMRRELR